MKKILCLLLVLILAACGSQADEVSRLEEERDHLLALSDEQSQTIAELQNSIVEFERQYYTSAVAYKAAILDSFMDNLDSVERFLGISGLDISEEDIALQGEFVTARSTYNQYWIHLVFRYRILGEEFEWSLIEYTIGPISGSGIVDGGRYLSDWQQDELFDENFTIRFYRHHDHSPAIYEYFDEEILYEGWREQVISHMRAHTGIQIAHLWYEGSRLVVDLTPWGAVAFDCGSHGSAMLMRSLVDSLSGLPNVTEIEVLVGGQRGVSASHFMFMGAFSVN